MLGAMNAATSARQGIPLRPDPGLLQDRAIASLTRAAIAVGMNALDRTLSASHFASHEWPEDRAVEYVLRAAVSPTSTATAAALVQIAYAFLPALTPMSAAADLFGRALSLSFDGAGSISVPGISLPSATFVGEGSPIPVHSGTSAGVTLHPFKLATITSLTGEMIRNSNAEALVRDALLASVGPSLDAAVFSAAPADSTRPAGLLNGIAALSAAGATPGKAEAMVDDIATLASAIAPVGNGNVALIASPAQAIALALRAPHTLPAIMTSAALPAGSVIMIALGGLVSAIGGAPTVSASQEAEVHMESGPSQIIDDIGTVAKPVRSFYQTDSIGLKLTWPVTWALRDARAVAWMQSVNW